MNFEPHDYQAYAIDYIETHPVAAVLLDMGLGKTVISLTAIADLLFDSFEAHRVLVVAPLRVARDTWPAEIEKWAHLQDLTYTVAVGSARERKAALMVSTDITIINRENLSWLIESSGFPFDYDTVVIDELSSFKNHQSKRFKALLRVRPKVKRIIGLTGTPSSNGLMDLWAEFRLLDMGHRLGRFITQYRNTFFLPDKRNGQIIYSYKPMPGAEEAIYSRISDITISMKSTDHLKMPELVSTRYEVYLSDAEADRYEELKQALILQLPDGGGEVGNPYNGQVFHRPGGGLIHRGGQSGGPPLGDDDPMGPHGLGGADDSPQVVGVLQLVADDKKRRLAPVLGKLKKVLQPGVIVGGGHGDHPLMVPPAAEGVQLDGADLLQGDSPLLDHGDNLKDRALQLPFRDVDAFQSPPAFQGL